MAYYSKLQKYNFIKTAFSCSATHQETSSRQSGGAETDSGLLQKRLERERWPWPQTQEEAMEIKNEDLELLLKGINVWKRHSELHYEI